MNMEDKEPQSDNPKPASSTSSDTQPAENSVARTWDHLSSQTVSMRKPAVIIIAAVAVVALLVCVGVSYSIGRSQAISGAVLDQNAQLDAKYRSLSQEVQDKQIELNNANGTIAQAENTQNGIDDLNKQHDDLQKKVKDEQAQLDSLTGQVANAKKTSASDGVWQVGTDIDPGTYKAGAPVGSDCYWAIMNGDNIVQNDLPGGGYPQATVSVGQQLKIQDCGTWVKQ